MGDWSDTSEARGDRTSQDHVGCADHHPACIAAWFGGRVVPDRGGECEGVRLAAAIQYLSMAIARTPGDCHGGCAFGGTPSRAQACAHAANTAGEDFRR